jgi:predicted glutamine amidotransferase
MAQFLQAYPLKSRNIIAHVRKATIGEVALENAHPFVRELWGRQWVFAHNGDLKDYTGKAQDPPSPWAARTCCTTCR